MSELERVLTELDECSCGDGPMTDAARLLREMAADLNRMREIAARVPEGDVTPEEEQFMVEARKRWRMEVKGNYRNDLR